MTHPQTHDTTSDDLRPHGGEPPTGWRRLKHVGPGLIIAATGIGAGDMVNGLNAGTNYGGLLLWAIVLGTLIKFPLSEATGRLFMVTGKTVLQAWHDWNRAASGYFIAFFFLASFITAAGICSAAGLAMSALFPGVMPLWAWAILHSLLGFVLVWVGRYGLFEKVMGVLIGLMFVTVITLAFLTEPDVSALGTGLIPNIPDGASLAILAMIGGIGGSQSLAFYPYWVKERGWTSPKWIPMMRTDLTVGYVATGIFMVGMMLIGSGLLFGTGLNISGSEGLVTLVQPLEDRVGYVARAMFLIGFWAAATSTIFGVWDGSSHLFADFVRIVKKATGEQAVAILNPKGKWARGFLVFIAFPPMILLIFDKPVLLVIIYSALGAVFFPFLAASLLWFMNGKGMVKGHRNGILSNIFLAVSGLFFVVFGILAVTGAV